MTSLGGHAPDLERIKRNIASGPIGLYISMLFAYATLCALICAATFHELLEDGRNFLTTQRLDLQLEFKALIVLCHEHLGHHTLPAAEFVPEPIQLDRIIGWLPLCLKSAWPGPTAVPRAP